jgi:RNA recognition motif-containing protein
MTSLCEYRCDNCFLLLTGRSDDFKALFQPFGSIEHAVILAVLDNFSRRRGFVVFASHNQARSAMRAIHKSNVKYGVFSFLGCPANRRYVEVISSTFHGQSSNVLQASWTEPIVL